MDPTAGEIPEISARNVSKTFGAGGTVAVQEASFDLPAGLFASLIGPSGCGKSTLLRLVAGLIDKTSGSIQVRGEEVSQPRPDVAMMFQKPVLLEWITALENALLPLKISGQLDADARRHAEELFATLGLSGFEHAYPRHLSGGMQQRVALARLLITDARVLLMDEPFAALDEFTRERLNLELAELQQRLRKTVMFVTHNINEALFLSDRVFVMTRRPARLAEIVEVPFARPRPVELLATPEFNELALHVRALFGEHR